MSYPCPQYPQPPVTAEMIAALYTAIATGTKEVEYADKRVVYQSASDIMAIIRWMEGLLYPCSGVMHKSVGVYDSGLQRPHFGAENEEIYWRTW